MSNTIDKRVVKIDFDNEQFESRTKTTIGTLEKLKQALTFSHANDGLDKLNKSVKGFNMNPLGAAADAVSVKFNALQVAAFTALQNIVNRAVNAGIEIAKSLSIDQISAGFGEYELKMGSIQTIMASTGEDLETVSAYLEELNTYADKTIYSFSDMTSNIGKFTNAGVKLEDAVKAIQGVSNEAAVSGANANEASRAMYNFAQALSAGYVKLIDWKSIENANMATVEFKEQLIETAVAMGTVVKEGDMYRSVTTDLNGKTSELFDTTHMFNDSLSSQWMSTEVLVQALNNYSTDVREMSQAEVEAYEEKLRSIGYTDEQIQKIEELGKKAFDSAQDVKTFSQLMDTLKESVGSGWAQTFEIIFGNFEEAKSLWTSINDYIGDVLQKQADARNDLLREWKAWGGRDMLMDSLVNVWNALLKVLTPVKRAFRDVFPSDFLHKIEQLTIDFHLFSKNLGISAVTSANIRGTFQGLFSVIGIGADVIKEIAGFLLDLLLPAFSDGSKTILEFTSDLGRNVKAFREWLQETGYIRTALEAIKSIVVSAAVAIKNWFISFEGLPEVQAQIAKVKGKFQEFAVMIKARFPDTIKKFNELKEAFGSFWNSHDFSKVTEPLKTFASVFKQEFLAVWNKFKVSETFAPFITGLTNLWNKTKGIFTSLVEKIKSFVTSLKSGYDAVNNAAAKFGAGFKKVEGVLAPVAGFIGDHIGDIIAALMLLFTAKTIKSFIKGASDLTKNISKALTILTKPFEAIGGLFNEMKNALRSFSGVANAAKNALNGLVLIEVVAAIGAIAYIMVKLKDYKLEDFKTGAIVVGAIAIVVMAILSLIALINRYKSKIDPGIIKKQTSTSLKVLELAGALYLVVKSFMNLYSIIHGGNIPSIKGAAAGIVIGLVVLIKAMGQLNKIQLGNLNWKSLFAMIGAASALKLIVSAFSDLYVLLKDARFKELKEPLIAFGGTIGALLLILNQLSKAQTVKGVGGNLLLSVISLKVLVSVLKDLTTLDLSGIGDHIGSFILVVTSFGLLMKAISKMPSSSGSSGAGILAAAVAIRVLAGAIKMIGGMSLRDVAVGTGAVAAMMVFLGVFAKLADGANIPVKTAVTFLALSVAIGILALIVVALGLLNPQDVLVGTAAIDSMLICIGVVLVAAKLAEGVKVGPLFVLVAAFGILATALILILKFADDSKSIAVAAAALDSLMLCFSILIGVTGLVSKAGGSIGAGLATVGVLTLVVAALAGILYLLAENVKDSTKALECAEALTLLMLSMSAVMVAAAVVGTVGVVALAGVGIGALVVAALAGLLYALSGIIDENPDIETKLERMGEIMNKIGNVFGEGVAGFLEGATSSLEAVGANLSAFADSSAGFFEAMKGITPEMGQGVQNMATALLELSGTDLINTIVTALGGNVGSFGTTLTSFGQALIDYSDVLAGGNINADAITKSAEAGQALADLQNSLPKTGGLWQKIAGAENISNFGAKINAFGMMLRNYNRTITSAKLDTAAITASATAGQALADLQNSLPQTGGLWQKIAGVEDISDFGAKINAFAEAIMGYSEIVSGFTYSEGGPTQSVITCATELSGLAETVTGTSAGSTLSSFGDDISDFGYNINLFYSYLADVDATKIAGIATSLTELVTASDFSSIDFSGFTTFSDNLSNLATASITDFCSAFSNSSDQVILAIAGFLTVASNVVSAPSDAFGEAGSAAAKAYADSFGNQDFSSTIETKVTSIIGQIVEFMKADAEAKFTAAGSDSITLYFKGYQSKFDFAKKTGVEIVSNVLSGLDQNAGDFLKKGTSAGSSYTDAIARYASPAYKAGASLGSNATRGLASNVGPSRSYGSNFGAGFESGILGYSGRVYNAAYSIGRSAVDGLKKAIDAHSPSEEAKSSGGFFGVGFVSGILKWVSKAGDAATMLGDTTVSRLNKVIADIPNQLADSMNLDPVVRPVVDLSSAQASVAVLNDMFNRSIGIEAAAASVTGASMAISRASTGVVGGTQTDNGMAANDDRPVNVYNTFNITSDNPEEVANRVSYILQKQVERKRAVWG